MLPRPDFVLTSPAHPRTLPPPVKPPRIGLIVAAWATLIAAAVALDIPISRWAHDSGLSATLKSQWPRTLWSIRRFGVFWSYPLVAAILFAIAGARKKSIPWCNVAWILLAGVLSGLNASVKWIVGRHRPYHGFGVFEFHPCQGPFTGLMGMESGLSFPSGDVCLAAATSTCLAILFPRWRWMLILVVLLVALERVAEGAHYPSDTAAGALLGWAMALVARYLTAKLRGKSQ
jgi:membrane-associated phospholipid phosphatase